MTLYWSRYSGWEPQGGQRKAWRDLEPGDLIELRRKIWRVAEVRLTPVIDLDEHDRGQSEQERKAYKLGSEEDWQPYVTEIQREAREVLVNLYGSDVPGPDDPRAEVVMGSLPGRRSHARRRQRSR